jgi:transposase-like protein
MTKLPRNSEQFQHFLSDLRDQFWGDLQQHTRSALKKFLDGWSERERDQFVGLRRYERYEATEDGRHQGKEHGGREYRNGYYERDWVTRFGTIRLRIARTRGKNFLPKGLRRFQRRADEVGVLIREAFLRGISTRQVGRVVALITDEVVSAQTVSRLTRDLDELVRQFHQAKLEDDVRFLFLDGVSLRMRGPDKRKRVHMLVAYGVRADGTRRLLAFMRSRGESEADWRGLLEDMYRRGLVGNNLALIVTDGCPGLAAAIQIVYPRAKHQRCWVHKMRNILQKVKKSDYDQVKSDAQAIYKAENTKAARQAFREFKLKWMKIYHPMVKQLQKDLPELLSFMSFPAAQWKMLRTTNVIERCFVEVRRRTRPMVCFVNVKSVDRIIYSIFNRFNLEWENRTLRAFTQAA